MALSASQKLSAAILRVTEPPVAMAPYFGSVLRGLVRRQMSDETEAVMRSMGMKPTLFVTGDGVMQWSASFVDKIDVVELSWALIHEVGHVVLNHHARALAQGIPPRLSTPKDVSDSQLWNWASDCSWNAELRKMNGAKLPGFWIMPETLEQPENLIAEERYRLLKQKIKKLQKQLNSKLGSGACGSCSGHVVPGEPPPGKGAGGEGRSEAELERMRKQVAQDIQSCKDRGTVPASLERWANDYLKPPRIDWRTKLARLVRGAVAYRAGQSDFTFSRMSRRQAGVGYGVGRPVIPALHSPVPSIAIALDVSGSMSPDLLAAALVEIRGVLSAVGAQVTFVICDAKVHGIKVIKNIDEAVKMMVGGGGTYLEPAVKAVSELKEKPSVLIMMTDGYCDDPPNYGLELIWAVVGDNTTFAPTHGEVVNVEEDAA